MKKFLSILVLIGILFGILGTSEQVRADGMIVHPDYYPVYETQQKALIIREDNIEDLVISISFNGTATEFGWIVPLPNKPTITKVDASIFQKLNTLTEPKQNLLEKLRNEQIYSSRVYSGIGFDTLGSAQEEKTTVEVIEEKSIGIYDYAILQAQEVNDLKDWMEENGYNLPTNEQVKYDVQYNNQGSLWSQALPVLQNYIDSGWYFVTIKVNNKFTESSGVASQLATGAVDPLRFTFETTDTIYPMKLSSLSQRSVSVLLYVIDKSKITTENYLLDSCTNNDCSRFTTQYASTIKKSEIEDLTKEIGKGSWYSPKGNKYITKLYTYSIQPSQMTEELLLTKAKNDSGVNNGTMSLAEWIELPFVVVLYLPYLILGGIFDLFSGNMYASSDVKVFGTIFILLALFVGSVLWILLSTKILKRTQKKYKRILLYCFQFPSVWFVSTSLSILLVIPFVILLIFVRVRDEVGVLDSICIATFFIGLFPVLFYKLIWRHRKKKEVINH